MFDGHLRTLTDRGVKPIGTALARIGVTPDQLTAAGLAMSVATAIAIGSGHTLLGFFLLLSSALPDLFDGAVAKASGTSSIRGAFFDSVADRVTDAFLLGGIAWHLDSVRGGRVAMLAFAVLGVSTLISYQRAKAEVFGFDAKGGLMERAERITALCVGLVFHVLIPVLWVMLVLTAITAVQRFVKVWRQADKPAAPTVVPVRSGAARPASRWATRADGVTLSARMRANRVDRAQWRARFATRSRNTNTPPRSLAATWRDRQRHRSSR